MELKKQSELIKKLQEKLNIPEGFIFKVTASQRGVPDISFIYKGTTFWIECKEASGNLSKEQQDFIKNTDYSYVCIFMKHETVILDTETLYTVDEFTYMIERTFKLKAKNE